MSELDLILPHKEPSARLWIPGGWYDWSHGQLGGLALNTSALSTGTVYAEPLFVPEPCTLDRIGLDVTVQGSAGATMRLAVFDQDPATLYPGDLLLDVGELAVDTTGSKEATISLPVAAGWHHLAFETSATITVRVHIASNLDYYGLTGPGDTNRLPVSRMTMAYGAFPATWTHSSRGSTAPAIAVRMV